MTQKGGLLLGIRPSTLATILAGVVVTVVAGGCDDSSERARADVTQRDSAGIGIMENHLPGSIPRIAFQLSPEPRVRIGRLEGSDAEQLFRIQGGAVLSDGRIALLNAGTREVRIYGADGEHLTSFGGAGDGPGEFGYPSQLVFFEPDTLMVWDLQTWRTTWFDLEGNVLGDDTGRTKYGPRIPEGMFAEGGFALRGGGLVLRAYEQSNGDRPTNEIYRPESALILLPRTDDSAVLLPGRYGGIEQMMIEEAGRPQPVVVPFGKRSAFAVGGEPPMIWAGNNDAFELWGYDTSGRVVRILRTDLSAQPVTPEAFGQLKEIYRASMSSYGVDADELEAEMRRLDLAPLPSAMPHYSSVLVARDGGLWIESYREEGDPSPHRYHVFDADGRWLGVVDTPGRFDPLDIGRDYVLAKVTDELDVEYVVLHDLR